MKTIDEGEAKKMISRLLDVVAIGEDVIITRAGRPMARLIPYQGKQQSRKPGCWKGQVKFGKDFDDTSGVFSKAFQD